MDDFSVSSLYESKNEWGSRLLSILTPLVIEGIKSIFDEALSLCKDNNETDKYLMTFQNFISRIPKWNQSIIETERKRIYDRSGCGYLEDLVTCVHIIQLKLLTAIRAGNKQKKIDISIPKLDDFIHKTYIHVARKIYKNVYLFELNIAPLQTQKNFRELEIIVQECILTSIRESIPVEAILKAYMDETIEEDVVEDIKEEIIEDTKFKEQKEIADDVKMAINENISVASEPTQTSLSFNNIDSALDSNGNEIQIPAPKDYDTLETISEMRNEERKRLESEEDDDDNEPGIKLNISDQPFELSGFQTLDKPLQLEFPDLLDVEVLE